MKLKTSISIIGGCLVIFLFIMLPIFLSMQDKKDESIASFKGSDFSLKDMNNNTITQESFNGPLTAIFFGFTNCPDVCPMSLSHLKVGMLELEEQAKEVQGTHGRAQKGQKAQGGGNGCEDDGAADLAQR